MHAWKGRIAQLGRSPGGGLPDVRQSLGSAVNTATQPALGPGGSRRPRAERSSSEASWCIERAAARFEPPTLPISAKPRGHDRRSECPVWSDVGQRRLGHDPDRNRRPFRELHNCTVPLGDAIRRPTLAAELPAFSARVVRAEDRWTKVHPGRERSKGRMRVKAVHLGSHGGCAND